MAVAVAKVEWVRRVLKVEAGQAQAPNDATMLTADLPKARKGLIIARDAMLASLSQADLQIRKLQAVLAVHPDPDLQDIAGSADIGINALTGGYRVRMLVALQDLENASPDKLPTILTKARTVVAGFVSHIKSSDRLAACDENPLRVPVAVRPMLTTALVGVARSIDAFAAH